VSDAKTEMDSHYHTAACDQTAADCPSTKAYLCIDNDATPMCTCDATCDTCSALGASNCLTCWSNATVTTPPGVCVCDAKYFPNTSSDNCDDCHSTCATCNELGADKCLTCNPALGARLVNGISPGSCECMPGWFGASADACVKCHGSCATCSEGANAAKCSTCIANATETGTADNYTCPCDLYYWYDTTGAEAVCSPCHTTCKTCNDQNADGCVLCKPNAARSAPGAAGSTCICPATGFYGPAENCLPCHASCTTGSCIGAGIAQCTVCDGTNNADGNKIRKVNGVDPTECICKDGFFMNTGTW
jgi:hypothetical protein